MSEIDVRFVLRTLKRMRQLSMQLTPEALAEILAKLVHPSELNGLSTYLSDVFELMKKQHEHRRCVECGGELDCVTSYNVRPEARYCSSKCRQRAYRTRVEQIDLAIRKPRRNKRRVFTDDQPHLPDKRNSVGPSP
jgi:hypothetical protein